jgi:hypothetical protein
MKARRDKKFKRKAVVIDVESVENFGIKKSKSDEFREKKTSHKKATK